MKFKDYYKVLGVQPDATNQQIKTAYRKLARKYHPDLSDHQDAEDRFKEVSEAYEVLKDSERRAEFDEIRQYGVHGQSFQPPPGWQKGGVDGVYTSNAEGFSEFFSSLFGKDFGGEFGRGFNPSSGQSSKDNHRYFYDRHAANRGRDIETDLPIFLEDTLQETHKTLSYYVGGVNRTLSVKIPAGATNGEKIRLKGQGELGFDDGDNGDLYLRIRLVPHPIFDIEGHNLVAVLPLAPWEAALGTKVDMPTLDGKVRLTISANSQSGQKLRIKGKGLINKQGQAGDLYAVIQIHMPTDYSDKERQLWQSLADEKAPFNPRQEWSKL